VSAIREVWDAIEEADVDRVRDLLREHPEVLNATDEHGFTPLMYAASCIERQESIVRALIELGAEVNRQTAEGYTALHLAVDVDGEANLNCRQIISVLVAGGADLATRQHWGWTPLLRAVVEGTGTEVEALLDLGANPNDTLPASTLPDFNSGRTALMAALSTCDSEEKVRALMRAGADPSRTGTANMTFFDLAQELEREYAGREFGENVKRCAEIVRKSVQAE